MKNFYTCTLLPDVTRDDPPKLGVRDNETGVKAAFWREEDRALFMAAPDMLEALESMVQEINHGDSFPAWQAAKAKMRSAIAKARGNA